MKNKWLLILIGGICLILVLVALPFVTACNEKTPTSEEEASTPAEPIEIRYSTYSTAGSPSAEMVDNTLAREIEKRTNGRVHVTIYWRDTLAKAEENFAAVRSGLADMGMFASSYIPGRFPLSDIANLPFACTDTRALPKIMWDLVEKGYFDKEWGEVELLAWQPSDLYVCCFKKVKPLKFEDLAGLKVRTPGGNITDFLKACGMVPVDVPTADSYVAWDRGLVDAWQHTAFVPMLMGFDQSGIRSILMWHTNTYVGQLIFNKERWASLPPDIQEIIRDVCREHETDGLDFAESTSAEAIKVYEKEGIEMYTWPDSEMKKVREAASTVWDKFIADMEALGLPGQQMVHDFVTLERQQGEEPVYSK
jgi:TRAP-type C4-dicarboxylate transport system substrate-binding protein